MSPITILNKANVPQGPFTREQVAQKLAAGEFTPESLAHVEGLAQWTPLREVLARVDAAVLPAVPPPPIVPPAQMPAYSYAVTMEPPPHLVYAGFWLRFVAYFLDSLILGAAMSVVLFILGLITAMIAGMVGANFNQNFGASGITRSGQPYNFTSNGPNATAIAFIFITEIVMSVIILGATWFYFAKLESGPEQATFGKRIMGLQVKDLAGQRIGFGRASGRFFGKIVSSMTLYIGFIMAGVTDRKQALHDMMAGTLVVKK